MAELVVIGGKGKDGPPPPVSDDGEEPMDRDAAKMSAAKALITAVKNGDADAVNDALSAHYEACE